MKTKVCYPCKCGKTHEYYIQWPEGITYLSCGRRINNSEALKFKVKQTSCKNGCDYKSDGTGWFTCKKCGYSYAR